MLSSTRFLGLAGLVVFPGLLFGLLFIMMFWQADGKNIVLPLLRLSIANRLVEEGYVGWFLSSVIFSSWLPGAAVVALVPLARLRRCWTHALLLAMLYALTVFAFHYVWATLPDHLGRVALLMLFCGVTVPILAMLLLPEDWDEDAPVACGDLAQSRALNRQYWKLCAVCGSGVAMLVGAFIFISDRDFLLSWGGGDGGALLFILIVLGWLLGVVPVFLTVGVALLLFVRRNAAGAYALALCGLCFAAPFAFVLKVDSGNVNAWFYQDARTFFAVSVMIACAICTTLLPPADAPESAFGIGSRTGRRWFAGCVFVLAPLAVVGKTWVDVALSYEQFISSVTDRFSPRIFLQRLSDNAMWIELAAIVVGLSLVWLKGRIDLRAMR